MVNEGERVSVLPRKSPHKVLRGVSSEDESLLVIAVMAVNTTVEPEGLCPTLLMFGAMPKLPIPDSGPSSVPQAKRMLMLEIVRE